MGKPAKTRTAPDRNLQSWTWRDIEIAAKTWQQLVVDIHGEGKEPYGLKAEVLRKIASQIDRSYTQVRHRLASCGPSFKDARHLEPPTALFSEREQRRAAANRRNLTAEFFGDPPVGCSALDRRRSLMGRISKIGIEGDRLVGEIVLTPVAHILRLLAVHRLTLSDEKRLQADIATVLTAAKLSFRREVRLGGGDIVDFMVDDPATLECVAIEVKIKGNARSIYRQLERYCAHDEVRSIILATNVPMNLPETINGKPTAIAALGRGWL